MSDTIHLIVEGEPFDIQRVYLEKFSFFRDMLTIYDDSDNKDSIELKNIDSFTFKILMKTVVEEVNVKEKVAVLCDYLGYDYKLDLVKEYYCNFGNCTNIALNGYCVNHKCKIDKCINFKGKYDYCTHHRCKFEGCGALAITQGMACDLHKCVISGCEHFKSYDDYCAVHGKLLYGWCVDCSKNRYNCCYDHQCEASNCKNPKMRRSRYCFTHREHH